MQQQLKPPWYGWRCVRVVAANNPKGEQRERGKSAITGCGRQGGVEEVARVVAMREGHLFLGSPPLHTRAPVAAANDGRWGGFTGLSWLLGLGSGGEPFPGAGPHGQRGSQSAGVISPWRDWLAQQRIRTRSCSGDPNFTFAPKPGGSFRGCPIACAFTKETLNCSGGNLGRQGLRVLPDAEYTRRRAVLGMHPWPAALLCTYYT